MIRNQKIATMPMIGRKLVHPGGPLAAAPAARKSSIITAYRIEGKRIVWKNKVLPTVGRAPSSNGLHAQSAGRNAPPPGTAQAFFHARSWPLALLEGLAYSAR